MHGNEPGVVIDRANQFASVGRLREAIDLLVDVNLEEPDRLIDERLVQLRRDAGRALDPSPVEGVWAEPVPDLFAEPGIPEVPAAEFTARTLHSALTHRGSLIVRGLLDRPTADHLREQVKRAFAAAAAWQAGAPTTETSPWYLPFEAVEPHQFGQLEREFSLSLGGVLSVESPRLLFEVLHTLKAVGLGRLLDEYFGEWPMVSAKKSTLRRARPDSPTEWHQDGAFLGRTTRTANVWTALSHCGVDAPGIDIVAEPFDHIVETGTDSALFSWSVSPERAEIAAHGSVVRPVFAPGDALIFDQMSLHRTGISPSMTEDRYAIESWFFAPSTYPHEQVPILF